MSRIRVAPIVEGHGEERSVRTLIQRVWSEMLGGEHAEVLKPIRGKRYRLNQPKELERAIHLAVLKMGSTPAQDDPRLVLVILDADDDKPCQLGPELLHVATKVRADMDVSVVVANVEYETWFVACAESLGRFLDAPPSKIPEDPEAQRSGKGWVARHFIGGKYSETLDQPRMTAEMDLALCRTRSPSFDKLCRELEQRKR